MRQLLDEMGSIHVFRRLAHALIADTLIVQADVAGDRAGEDERILQHRPDVFSQVFLPHIAHIDAIDADRPFLYIIEARDQANKRGLAGARRTHKGNAFSGANLE